VCDTQLLNKDSPRVYLLADKVQYSCVSLVDFSLHKRDILKCFSHMLRSVRQGWATFC